MRPGDVVIIGHSHCRLPVFASSCRFEKSRRAAVEVTYQRGFSIGGRANFKLGLPMVLPDGELSSEINMHYEVYSSSKVKHPSITMHRCSDFNKLLRRFCVCEKKREKNKTKKKKREKKLGFQTPAERKRKDTGFSK